MTPIIKRSSQSMELPFENKSDPLQTTHACVLLAELNFFPRLLAVVGDGIRKQTRVFVKTIWLECNAEATCVSTRNCASSVKFTASAQALHTPRILQKFIDCGVARRYLEISTFYEYKSTNFPACSAYFEGRTYRAFTECVGFYDDDSALTFKRIEYYMHGNLMRVGEHGNFA